MTPIDQALSILAATAWQTSRKRNRITRRGRRILRGAIAYLRAYQTQKGVKPCTVS